MGPTSLFPSLLGALQGNTHTMKLEKRIMSFMTARVCTNKRDGLQPEPEVYQSGRAGSRCCNKQPRHLEADLHVSTALPRVPSQGASWGEAACASISMVGETRRASSSKGFCVEVSPPALALSFADSSGLASVCSRTERDSHDCCPLPGGGKGPLWLEHPKPERGV